MFQKKCINVSIYVCSILFSKYFCRVDEVAHTGYQNQKENLRLLHLQQRQQQQQQIASIKQEQIDQNETVEVKVIDEKKICHRFLLKPKKKRKTVDKVKKIF